MNTYTYTRYVNIHCLTHRCLPQICIPVIPYEQLVADSEYCIFEYCTFTTYNSNNFSWIYLTGKNTFILTMLIFSIRIYIHFNIMWIICKSHYVYRLFVMLFVYHFFKIIFNIFYKKIYSFAILVIDIYVYTLICTCMYINVQDTYNVSDQFTLCTV